MALGCSIVLYYRSLVRSVLLRPIPLHVAVLGFGVYIKQMSFSYRFPNKVSNKKFPRTHIVLEEEHMHTYPAYLNYYNQKFTLIRFHRS